MYARESSAIIDDTIIGILHCFANVCMCVFISVWSWMIRSLIFCHLLRMCACMCVYLVIMDDRIIKILHCFANVCMYVCISCDHG